MSCLITSAVFTGGSNIMIPHLYFALNTAISNQILRIESSGSTAENVDVTTPLPDQDTSPETTEIRARGNVSGHVVPVKYGFMCGVRKGGKHGIPH
ncbi:hypothetical protein GWI33_016933 [Rhynchophorus ferrugineus]|uniref:Uncharacterized protein n=1 Tax=Rhynchophorus ferrugineus TaxID=354439 RepID=A0A834M869_RHYFE|nr:hypothetical protein GWI33_016933 [Rhynchophorus ferrugineus]